MTLNTNDSEIDEILRSVITEKMAQAYLVETEGYPSDAEERHYFNTESGKEYQDMLVKKAKQALDALIASRIVEELEGLITNYSQVHIVRKTIIYGSDTVTKGSQLGMIPTLYVNDRISKLKQGNSND